jgi:phosphonoacetaldehyde hydrolase
MSLKVRAVVFDWAGTTVDFGCIAPTGAFVSAFAARGVAVTGAEARGPMGLHKKDHLRAMLGQPGLAARWRAAYGRDWAEADVTDLYGLVTPLQVEAVARHSALIPGALTCMESLKIAGVKIGGTTGYFQAAADVVYRLAADRGYRPDFAICADEVPAGRPAPWMIFRAMEALGVYPPAAVVKVGDTVVDIADGLNAGVWSVGVLDSSSEMGLTEAEFAALDGAERTRRREVVASRFQQAGAHAVVRTVAQVPALVDHFNALLAAGQNPGSVTAALRPTP